MSKFSMSINEQRALNIIGGMASGKPHLALKELVDNGLDAGARNIYVLYDQITNSLVVADDGHGIFGEISKEDLELLQLTAERPSELSEFDNPENWNSPFSLWSFQYMILHNAHSVKSLEKTYNWLINKYVECGGNWPENIGVKGIGFLSCLFGCNRVEVVSKPHPQLAQIHYKKDIRDTVHRLLYPEHEKLRQGDDQPEIKLIGTKLVNPATEEEMPFGTVVTMHGIASGLTPDRIVYLLEQTFGLILQRTPTKIFFYIRKEVKQKIGAGRSLSVPTIKMREITGFKLPSKYLYQEEITSGNLSANVRIWTADKDSFPISFFQSGVRAGEVSALEGLGSVWSNRNLTGIVELSGPNTIWNTTKDLPDTMQGVVVSLLNKLASIEGRLESIYTESLKTTKSSEVGNILRDASSALGDILAADETNLFSKIVQLSDGAIYRGEKAKEKKARERKDQLNTSQVASKNVTSVFVIDEWGLPVPNNIGITVSLKSLVDGTTLSAQSPTSGSLAFGSLRQGKYRVTISIPVGMNLISQPYVDFEINKQLPAKVLKFSVKTNLSPRIKNKAPSLNIYPKMMGVENQLVDASNFASSGVIYINTEAEAFEKAYSGRDYGRLASAIAYPVMMSIGYSTISVDSYVLDVLLKAAQSLEQDLTDRFKSILKEKR